jgi:hypothetical protein
LQGILFDVDAVAAERTQRCRSALEDHGLDLDVPLPATAIMSLGNTRLPDGWSEVKRSCRTRRLVLSSERYLLQADPKTKQITIGPLTDDQAASRRGRQQVCFPSPRGLGMISTAAFSVSIRC